MSKDGTQEVKLLTVSFLNENHANRIACPRPKQKKVKKFKIVKEWKFEESVFKNYKRDTKSLLDACFDFDWRCSKLEKVLN